MKKLISLILISILLITVSTVTFASNSVLDDEDNTTTITGNEYNNAQSENKNNNTTALPQTGVEDYGVGMLLIVCAASAIFAYKKIADYKNI